MNPSFGIHFEPVFKSLLPSLSGVTTHYPPKELPFIPVSTVNGINNVLVPMHSKVI